MRKKESVDNYQNTHGRNDTNSAFQEGKLSQTISNLQYLHSLPFPQNQITHRLHFKLRYPWTSQHFKNPDMKTKVKGGLLIFLEQ